MTRGDDPPWLRLARHFFASLFDLGIFSDVAAESFKRLLIGISAALFSLALLLARIYMVKYANLSAFDSPEPYRRALLADHALFMALPMWVIALVTTLAGHALFPDRTDYRVLMGLPVTTRTIFGAKLAALAAFAGIFVAGTHAAMAPLFLISSTGRWADRGWLGAAAAFESVNLLASAFALLSVVAFHGLLAWLAPRSRLLMVSASVRSALVCGLVLLLPLVARLPEQARAIAQGGSWLFVAPPVWFVALERQLIGDHRPSLDGFAGIALLATGLALGIAAGCYALLYRRFDLVIVRHDPWVTGRESIRRVDRDVTEGQMARRAIRRFTWLTLRRSVLHQGAAIALTSVSLGLALNSLLNAAAWRASPLGDPHRAALIASAYWVPFVLIFGAALAVRTALALPIELRANWIFRLTERPEVRADQVEAPAQVHRWLAVFTPVLLVVPLHLALVGGTLTVLAAVTALACGWLLSESLLRDWQRLPFTCSYVPGKVFVPQMILRGWLSFVGFTTMGTTLIWLAGRAPAFWLAGIVVITTIAAVLRRRRRQTALVVALTFEDQLPTEISPLRLSDD